MDFPNFLQLQGHYTGHIRSFEFQDRFDIITELRLGADMLGLLSKGL